MKQISIRCRCGSSIDFSDASESPIHKDSSPDNKGRKFLIEVRADEWQERHQACVAAGVSKEILISSNKAKKSNASR